LDRVKQEENQLGYSRYHVYDAGNNLTQSTDRDGRVTQYDYGHLNRETAERWRSGGTDIRTIAYTYDADGRMTDVTDRDGSNNPDKLKVTGAIDLARRPQPLDASHPARPIRRQ
jgi:YD repeat-containing protein